MGSTDIGDPVDFSPALGLLQIAMATEPSALKFTRTIRCVAMAALAAEEVGSSTDSVTTRNWPTSAPPDELLAHLPAWFDDYNRVRPHKA